MTVAKLNHLGIFVKTKLNIAEFSDIHLGNPRVPTYKIIEGLNAALPDNEITAALDWLIFAGDVTDRQLKMSDQHVYEIHAWVTRVLRICKKYDIVLRVLLGTPSHDWGQSKIFESINETAEIGADIRYIDTLHIEHIKRFDIDVLYIPDEYRPTASETWTEVEMMLHKHRLEKVDYIIMHGGFTHQFPQHLRHMPVLHDPDKYHHICRRYIFVGHIHQSSRNKRILAAGSFDRDKHGEEYPKGHIRVQVYDDPALDEVRFIENKYATKFITIDLRDVDFEDMDKAIAEVVKDMKEGAHLRVMGLRNSGALQTFDLAKTFYKEFTWTFEIVGAVDTPEIFTERDLPVRRESLNEHSLTPLLLERVLSVAPTMHARCAQLLMEIIDHV